MPLSLIDQSDDMLGSTITTIASSDTLKDSRAVINTNFTNLNSDKLENSAYYATTTHGTITSIPNLATVGTITSGVWNGTTLTVAKGGTGSTTLLANAVLLGNGTNAVTSVAGWGTSGQLLTSGGAGNPPTWTSAATDLTIPYSWTDTHNWSATTSFAATSTHSGITLTATGTAYMDVQSKGYIDAKDTSFAFGQVASTTAGVGTLTIAHGLGTTPRFIKLHFFAKDDGSTAGASFGVGMATSATTENCTYMQTTDGSGALGSAVDASNILHLVGQTNRTVVAGLTTLDATNIILTFTTFQANAGVYIQWEAHE